MALIHLNSTIIGEIRRAINFARRYPTTVLQSYAIFATHLASLHRICTKGLELTPTANYFLPGLSDKQDKYAVLSFGAADDFRFEANLSDQGINLFHIYDINPLVNDMVDSALKSNDYSAFRDHTEYDYEKLFATMSFFNMGFGKIGQKSAIPIQLSGFNLSVADPRLTSVANQKPKNFKQVPLLTLEESLANLLGCTKETPRIILKFDVEGLGLEMLEQLTQLPFDVIQHIDMICGEVELCPFGRNLIECRVIAKKFESAVTRLREKGYCFQITISSLKPTFEFVLVRDSGRQR